jgi:hypothetical protein
MSNPTHGEVHSIQHCVIKFVSDFAAGLWFSLGTLVSSTNKTDRHDITEILWKPEYREKTTNLPQSHWQTLSHNVVSSAPRHEWDSNSQALLVIGTDCTGSCKSNYNGMSYYKETLIQMFEMYAN